ncbi:hypothetical protein [Amaricoccus macauensis]|uniref:hypothetical protein n=1 Tax=Amaricoccus macauensis TaxID=57001 RepID=UPI003C7AC7B6
MEDEAIEITGEIGEGQSCFGTGETDGANKEPEAGLLMCEDVLDARPDSRLLRVGALLPAASVFPPTCVDEYGS